MSVVERPGTTAAVVAGDRDVDPRAVRVSLSATLAHADLPALVVEARSSPSSAAAPAVAPTVAPAAVGAGRPIDVLVDGAPVAATLVRLGPARAILRVEVAPDDGAGPATTTRLLLEAPESLADGRGVMRREVVVDGWRIELEIESERRAALRGRARRGREEAARGGPTEVHAIIPGRIVSVSVAPGDDVVAGQQLLVVEAMKMQNELRAPRDGTVSRVAVAAGETSEIGDLLLVLE